MLIHDHLKALFIFFLKDLICFCETWNHCPVFFLGGGLKQISSKEFSFENINNLTPGKDLKIFKGAFAENTKIKRAGLWK